MFNGKIERHNAEGSIEGEIDVNIDNDSHYVFTRLDEDDQRKVEKCIHDLAIQAEHSYGEVHVVIITNLDARTFHMECRSHYFARHLGKFNDVEWANDISGDGTYNGTLIEWNENQESSSRLKRLWERHGVITRQVYRPELPPIFTRR